MASRRYAIPAAALCVLAMAAIGVASASAKGITAVACEAVISGAGAYNNSHCSTPEVTESNYETVTIPEGVKTGVEEIGEGNSLLRFQVNGLALEVRCTEMHSTSGTVKNAISGGEGVAFGEEIVLHYTKCIASLQNNTTKTCEVRSVSGVAGNEATIETYPLKFITSPEHTVTFSQEAGAGVLMIFEVMAGNCGLMQKVKVAITGTLVGTANTNKHSHITFTKEITEGTLEGNLKPASYEGTHLSWMNGQPETTVGLQTS